MRLLITLVLATAVVASAQPYRCDWSVNGIGGGKMSSAAYRCGATAGQTATGDMAGTSFLALIGFWQADYIVGIEEKPGDAVRLVTGLHIPAPNPFSRSTRIRYSLALACRARLQVYDLSGRFIVTLLDAACGPGHHSMVWRGDDGGRRLPAGVYFLRLRAEGADEVRRVLVTR